MTDDSVLQVHSEDPRLVQMKILGEGGERSEIYCEIPFLNGLRERNVGQRMDREFAWRKQQALSLSVSFIHSLFVFRSPTSCSRPRGSYEARE